MFPVLNKASSIVATSLRYAQTVRHLRPVQIYGRVWHRFHVPKADLRPAPSLRARRGAWCDVMLRRPSMLGPTRFQLLNHVGEIRSPGDWNAPAKEKLWLYNLHYFDDLNAANRSERHDWHAALIARWIDENPPGYGNGWEPYPLSLRIVNWIKWALAGNRFEPEWVRSLAVQTRYLRARLEWHLLGNHLLANAKALVFAGVFFAGDEAQEWCATGLRILEREVKEQVLADGAHFELSPMYHAIIEEDLLDLFNLARTYPNAIAGAATESWCAIIARMRNWLAGMTHPDGEIAFFNDAATGVAPACAALDAYADRLGLPVSALPREGITHFVQSGYVRVQTGGLTAFLDVGRIGPDYLPGHAHADTLSFEVSLGQSRVIVNSGTSLYTSGPDRLRQRSTAAHSTVEVDGENSSEVWSSFRVARRAQPFGLETEESAGAIRVRCAHDGYVRLPGRVIHHREWRFTSGGFSVVDHLDGRFGLATARFHLHPAVVPEVNATIFRSADGEFKYLVEGGRATITSDTYHPEFGLSVPSHCLEVLTSNRRCEAHFSLDNA